jgi:excisionase family DNA binding protein
MQPLGRIENEDRPVRAAKAAPGAGAEYWKVERVARFLDVSNKRVYQLVQEKRLAAIRLGQRQMRIGRASLEAYVAALHEHGADEGTE